jgi:hypothetical protein
MDEEKQPLDSTVEEENETVEEASEFEETEEVEEE